MTEQADTPTTADVAEGNGDQAVELTPGSATGSILVPARLGFDPAQVEAIRRTVAKDCTDAELVMFLEVAARHELDPFAKQIFAAKMKGGVQIIVSRDGLLAKAHRTPDFRGLIGDVVCANDTFGVRYEGGTREITHEYALGKDHERGDVIGAWAEVRREGHDSTYFFAPMGEYQRSGDTPWKHHPSAMILKVAEVYALRKAYSISGVVGEEEISRQRRDLTSVPEIDWGSDEQAGELRALVDQANQLVPGSYRPTKVQAMLNGVDDDRRAEVWAELRKFVDDRVEPEAEVVDAVEVAE
jgi:phage recombination protein Bet